MDPASLKACITASLSGDANLRQRAELDLKQVQANPGFTDAFFTLIETDTDLSTQQFAAVHLKNCIVARWGLNALQEGAASPGPELSKALSDHDKKITRRRIVPVIRGAIQKIRAQLLTALQKILHNDFPDQWPEFLDETLSLLHAQDLTSVSVGLECLMAITRTYRFKSGPKEDFESLVARTFPHVLNIGTTLASETSPDAGRMLRTVLKTYKHTVYFELPVCLRDHQVMSGWCSLFLAIVAKTPPECSMPEDEESRELTDWWKCKKTAYVNLNRLFNRYGNPAAISQSTNMYAQVADSFIKDFAPVILQGYLTEVDKWVNKTIWLSKPCLSHTLTFLNECIKPKSMWEHLQPHMNILIEHLLFPVLCQSDDDLEQFETEPTEYIHRKMNFFEESSAPDSAATVFLVSLTKARRKQTFEVLNFVNGVVDRYESAPEDQKNPREKEGALTMIGTLASVILGKRSPIADKVELFFVRYVFPEFRSKHAFLRARACDTLEKFEQLDFKDSNNLLLVYQSILECLADPELPVRVKAALTLQPLIRHDVVKASMQQNIPQIMQQLLKLANEVDIDALANVMEEFVEVFAPQLTPFAVALSEQLRDTYIRIVKELIDRHDPKSEDDVEFGDFLDDKSVTALGVLQTIGTLILTLESSPDVLAHLETILLPVVVITLENKIDDLYNEVFEIIDSCTFSAKRISPTMWTCFELMHRTFKSGGELYLEDMLPALENFVSFGTEQLVQHHYYLPALLDIIDTNFTSPNSGIERICGCKLAEVLMLSLRGYIDKSIPRFISLAMNVLTTETAVTKTFKIHLMEMVINAIYFNPKLSLDVLESQQWTNRFFSLWFSSINLFARVHDKKLSICAISALLSLSSDQIPQSIMPGWPRLLQGAVRLFQTLPAAIKNREDAVKENEEDFTAGIDDDEEAEWEDKVEWDADADADDTGDVKDENDAYLEFLSQQATKARSAGDHDGEDDDGELEEEALIETPLDNIEPYTLFKAALLHCQQQAPELYANTIKHLSPEKQQVVQGVVAQADQIAAHQQQQAQQQQAQLQQAQQQQAQQTVPSPNPSSAGGQANGFQ